MMIVDLIDDIDLKEKLLALGAPIHAMESLNDIEVATLAWLQSAPEHKDAVRSLCAEWQQEQTTILPDVLELIQRLSE
ncbi:hypothetical protein J9B83_08495 [Marinomonas sp. A79]|uniref:Death domain-containing protein n=1 Tax=Marinomonas vulgaris TaxID=2823372 RepID=A0ABS5HBE8_9GAMM|nr:hypothetical protein [Marinomonas vulgaris]MBR7888986.1 hypothetical protein [Marinomonas vulgaris]